MVYDWLLVYAIIALFKSLSDSSNICVISALASVDCLFPCWVILDFIQDILNVMLWGSGSCLNPMENADIFVVTGSRFGYVHRTSSNPTFCELWSQCQFSWQGIGSAVWTCWVGMPFGEPSGTLAFLEYSRSLRWAVEDEIHACQACGWAWEFINHLSGAFPELLPLHKFFNTFQFHGASLGHLARSLGISLLPCHELPQLCPRPCTKWQEYRE